MPDIPLAPALENGPALADAGLRQLADIYSRVIRPLHPELGETSRIDNLTAVQGATGGVLMDYDTWSKGTGYRGFHLELTADEWAGTAPVTARPTLTGPVSPKVNPLLLSRAEAFMVADWYRHVRDAGAAYPESDALHKRLADGAEEGL